MSSNSSESNSVSNTNYEELASCKVAGVPIGKYRSLKTGLIVCIAQVEGPMVNGYFCLGKLVDGRDNNSPFSLCSH